jgi:ribosomal protein S5
MMKNKHNRYSQLGLKALKRAVSKAADEAKKNNLKIPYWENGKIIFEVPPLITEQSCS